MKISIIGAGKIGGTLGRKWAATGHQVTFEVRDPASAKVRQLLDRMEGRGAARPIGDSIEAAEVVLLAIPGRVVEDTLDRLGGKLSAKIVIDATNNMGREVDNALAAIGTQAPQAQLFRAFHNLGWENFADPVLQGLQADLYYCGEPGEAQRRVDALIADIGLSPVYVGDLDKAGLVDALTHLWFALAAGQGHGRHLAFKMLKG